MSDIESTLKGELCDLMVRLKLKNPDLGRKDMHTAVVAEGEDWKEVSFDQVKRAWKKMIKLSSEELEKQENLKQKEAASKRQCKYTKLDNTTESKNVSSEDWGNVAKGGHKSIFDNRPISDGESKVQDGKETLNRGRSPALEKQLEALRKNPNANYVVFTPSNESVDCSISLANSMGELFFTVLWNRAIAAPFGSRLFKRELWMIYQQLQCSLMPGHKMMLRKQLQEEFGLDPFEGK